ncbi:leucine-rich repeat domain-containing protein, partial [Tannerella forsythia]
MKQIKQFSIWIIALAGWMIAGAATVQAQGVNMSRYITLTVQSGQPIRLKFKAAAVSTPVRVVSGANSTDVTVGTDWTAEQNFTADGTTMTVYGDIDGFECGGNRAELTALDVSQNTQLEELYCQNNRLPALDVSQNTQLKGLGCSDNQLPALDVSACTRLEELDCGGNDLTALDVSACTQLKMLWCFENRLTALDVSACAQLEKLYCAKNNFSTAALNRLYCSLPDRTSTTEGVIYSADNNTDPGHANVLAS